MAPPCPNIPGFPSNLAIPGLSQDGQVTWDPGILGQGGVYGCPSWDNPGMARLLGNPGILGQGGVYGYPSWDNPGMARLLGNPRILGQGGVGYLGIPGYLDKGGIWLSILG